MQILQTRIHRTQRMTEDALTDCPKCEGSVERVIGKNVGIQFMGSGFYVNDANEKGAPST